MYLYLYVHIHNIFIHAEIRVLCVSRGWATRAARDFVFIGGSEMGRKFIMVWKGKNMEGLRVNCVFTFLHLGINCSDDEIKLSFKFFSFVTLYWLILWLASIIGFLINV